MAFAWYTPTLVQAFGSTKNTDINTNLNAIAAAFNAQNAQISVAQGYAVASSGSRNILVDLASVGSGGTAVVITLPSTPAVGDPPVTVTVVSPQVVAGTTGNISCCFTAANRINGINPTSGYLTAGLPFLTNAGDTITFLYIGGTVGWAISNLRIAPYINPTGAYSQFWFNSGTAPLTTFDGLESVLDTAVIATTMGIFPLIAGQSCAFTRRSGANTISLGNGGQTFNGVAGPYVISASNIRYLFTCVAASTFIVTT